MTIDLSVLMQHQDDLVATFHELLLPCPFCGHKITKSETRGFGGEPWISCVCGVSAHGGILELLSKWNRRDGKDFTLESEYAQRMVQTASEFAAFKKEAFQLINKKDKALEQLRASREAIAVKFTDVATVHEDVSPCLACGICPSDRSSGMADQGCYDAVLAWAIKEHGI